MSISWNRAYAGVKRVLSEKTGRPTHKIKADQSLKGSSPGLGFTIPKLRNLEAPLETEFAEESIDFDRDELAAANKVSDLAGLAVDGS